MFGLFDGVRKLFAAQPGAKQRGFGAGRFSFNQPEGRCPTCLGDGETTRWNRHEFIGVLDEKYLPDWAREKLMELTAPRQEASAAGEMKLE